MGGAEVEEWVEFQLIVDDEPSGKEGGTSR